MKAIFYLLLLLLAGNTVLQAQNLITLQSGDNATFYNNLDTALFYAKNGDDIYLPGGYIKANATTLKIDKAVNIIGVGYNPYTNPATENTIIQSTTIEIMPNVNGGSISGIYGSTLRIQDAVSNFTVSRCSFMMMYIGSTLNIQITETIVHDIRGSNDPNGTSPQNVSISNSIIGSRGGAMPMASANNWNELTCKNTIIMGDVTHHPLIYSIQNSLFENCIFLEFQGCRQMIGNSCSFRNCLYSGNCAIMQNSIDVNCIFGQDPNSMFVDPQDFVFNMKNDFRLQENSQGKNAGTDGTDIGIYGGRFPWKDGGLPVNPHIESKFVNGTTDTNGNLNVKIKVAAQEK